MQRLRTVTSLDVSAVAGHHAMPAALLFFLSYGPLKISANKVVIKISQKVNVLGT